MTKLTVAGVSAEATTEGFHETDVVVIGFGPVGQTVAALLGQKGHRVTVLERWPGLYGRARAGHIDHEIMRILQKLGAAGEVEADAALADTYVFQNASGEVLMSFDYGRPGRSGWRNDYIIYQPVLERALTRAVSTSGFVTVSRGLQAVQIEQHDRYVDVLARPIGEAGGSAEVNTSPQRIRAQYVVGADGANSFTRTRSGIPWTDLGFSSSWLVVDLQPIGEGFPSVPFDNTQVCDPRRPHCLFQLGRHHRRFEFAVLPGEDPAQLDSDDVAWELMSRYGFTDQNAAIERRAVYRFGSAVATRWRDRRVFLAGDAAHLMPPFMGQGMCTGVRDAANLAWRLDLALHSPALAHVLDDYETERAAQSMAIVQMSIAAGKVSCTFDADAAEARDHAFRAGKAPAPESIPGVNTGLISGSVLAGQLAPQGVVCDGTATGLFDDIVGEGWMLLVINESHAPDAAAVARLRRAVGLRVSVVDESADVEGTYREFFRAHDIVGLVYRPDFYIFGAAQSDTEMLTILNNLEQRLKL